MIFKCLLALIIATYIQIGAYNPIIISRSENIAASAKSSEKVCVLLNEEYSNAYLYSASTALSSLRHVYVWDPVFKATKPADEFSINDVAGIWHIIPVANRPKTFFIKNYKNNEYLHPAIYQKKASSSRVVFTSPYKSNDDLDTLMWNFYKLENGKYEIWSVKFNERKFSYTHNFKED